MLAISLALPNRGGQNLGELKQNLRLAYVLIVLVRIVTVLPTTITSLFLPPSLPGRTVLSIWRWVPPASIPTFARGLSTTVAMASTNRERVWW
ncbi:hypothetical protein BDV26DRAFT_257342 [Aspergillus bertholletiae]|uniref:Uncharacterized protein n=1 Tax=Aspergillus bertholletiae TaxID=1226010 RepID=A0A5N7BF74_9EURO|nr:hypothetical protein BDV26DRAFT_257342 [Aspergillus bertholletiae]